MSDVPQCTVCDVLIFADQSQAGGAQCRQCGAHFVLCKVCGVNNRHLLKTYTCGRCAPTPMVQ
jgi:hypothetical protein